MRDRGALQGLLSLSVLISRNCAVEGNQEDADTANPGISPNSRQKSDIKIESRNAQIVEAARNLCAAQNSSPSKVEHLFASLRELLQIESPARVSLQGSPASELSETGPNSACRSDTAVYSEPEKPAVSGHTTRTASHSARSSGGYSGTGGNDSVTTADRSNSCGGSEGATDADCTSPELSHSPSRAATPESCGSTAHDSMRKSRSLASHSTRQRHQEDIVRVREREQELLQELAQEQDAHNTTRNMLEASEQALEEALIAGNDASEHEVAVALELAGLRLQLKQMVAGNAHSAHHASVQACAGVLGALMFG